MAPSVSRLLLVALAAVALASAPRAQSIALPVTFEDPINYELTDFGGNASSLVTDPTDAANTVVQSVRTAGAACFAGTTVAEVTGFTERIPFTPGATTMSVRVWSPAAGIRVLFKVEEVGNPGLNVETFSFTTVAGAWETIVFDFGNPMPNTNPIQFGANYNKASIFFDFQCGLPGAPAADRTYYWDDVAFGSPPSSGQTIAEARALGVGVEVTVSGIVTRAKGAFTYFQDATAGMTVRQTSGAFFDDVASGAIAPGTRITVTGTTSEFNGLFQINTTALLSYSIDGTAAVPAAQMVTLADLAETHEAELVRIVSLTTDATGTFTPSTNYAVADASGAGVLRVVGANDSDIDGTPIPEDAFTFEGVVGQFNGGSGDTGYQLLGIALGDIEADPVPVVSLPITFEDPIDYELTDFGGNASSLVADPTDATNTVVQSVRTAGAACFAGTTVAEVTGFTERIPFAIGETEMSVRVWSPVAGIRVLFKVEEVGNPGLFVETLATTTAAGAWETLVFDFGNPGPNTNPIQFGANYNKASIFFDFSCDLNPAPPAPPERTYYWDDIVFLRTVASEPAPPALSVAPTVFPNPTTGDATVAFELAAAGAVTVEVLDGLGRRVASVSDRTFAAGPALVEVPSSTLAPGLYLVRVRTDASMVTTRFSVVR